jgi:hypothetical protein
MSLSRAYRARFGLTAILAMAALTLAVGMQLPQAAHAAQGRSTAGPVNVTMPVISGARQVGGLLASSPGTWNPTPTHIHYQWFQGSTAISGAIYKTYLASQNDQGQVLGLSVTAIDSFGQEQTVVVPAGTVAANPWRAVHFPAAWWPKRLACAGPKTCFAIAVRRTSSAVARLVFDGSIWRVQQVLSPARNATLDCGADGTCMTVAGPFDAAGRVWKYQNFSSGGWSAFHYMPPVPLTRSGTRWFGVYRSLSCISASFCAIELGGNYGYLGPGGSGGFLMTYNPTRGTSPAILRALGSNPDLNTLLRLGAGSPTWIRNWRLPRRVTPTGHLHGVACAGRLACILLDDGPSSQTVGVFNGQVDSHLQAVGPFEDGLGCAETNLCFMANHLWDGARWTTPGRQSPRLLYPEAGCALHRGCAGTSDISIMDGGNLRPVQSTEPATDYFAFSTMSGTTWGWPQVVVDAYNGPSEIDGTAPVVSVRCPAVNTCVILDQGGNSYYRAG